MAYTTQDFLDDYEISDQGSPFENDRAFEIIIVDDVTGHKTFGVVWAYSEEDLREDLSDIMLEYEYISRIDEIDPYKY